MPDPQWEFQIIMEDSAQEFTARLQLEAVSGWQVVGFNTVVLPTTVRFAALLQRRLRVNEQ